MRTSGVGKLSMVREKLGFDNDRNVELGRLGMRNKQIK